MVFFSAVVHPKTGRGEGFRLCLEGGSEAGCRPEIRRVSRIKISADG